MARPSCFQYSGAIYHEMARGDCGKNVFKTDDERKFFIHWLGQVCTSHGWRVHGWVQMGNHFHLLLETPQANLVVWMKCLMGTFSQGWKGVSNDWIASRLAIGHPGSVSRMISAGRTDKNVAWKRNELAEILFAEGSPRQ
jgi:REP element-mobilizing transposase RayT